MKFTKSGGQTATGPADWFTGTVYIDSIRNPDEEHWHGATPGRFMAHVVIQQADDTGRVVTWGDHVTDERSPPR